MPSSTLGALKQSAEHCPEKVARRSVKDELRANLIAKLRGSRSSSPLFPGIIGYDDTVVPLLINAVLSRHNFILLGLRGQAKSRILRALTSPPARLMPVVADSEINDNPY